MVRTKTADRLNENANSFSCSKKCRTPVSSLHKVISTTLLSIIQHVKCSWTVFKVSSLQLCITRFATEHWITLKKLTQTGLKTQKVPLGPCFVHGGKFYSIERHSCITCEFSQWVKQSTSSISIRRSEQDIQTTTDRPAVHFLQNVILEFSRAEVSFLQMLQNRAWSSYYIK